MSDPEPQDQSRQPELDNGGQSPLDIETEELEMPLPPTNGNADGNGHASEGTVDFNGKDPHCSEGWRDRAIDWIREHQVEATIICGIIMAVLAFCSLLLYGISVFGLNGGSSGSERTSPAAAQPLTSVPQVKLPGVRTWGALVEMPDDGGPLMFGLRIEDTGPQQITGLAARASLPTFITAVAGKCRYGVNQVAAVACSESIVGEDMQLPELHPGEWIHIVFMAEVSEEVPGGHFSATLGVTSDQTGEISETAEVKVPATRAEEAVRNLFRSTEEERDFWNGIPVLAPRSKRLLIAQWPKFTLEHPHAFSEVPGGPAVGLADLFYNHLFEGRVVELRATIIRRPGDYPGERSVVKQSVELGTPGEPARLRCYTPRSNESLLRNGDEVELKAVPFAWPPPDGPGDGEELTMAVCPAARVVGK